MDNGLHGDYELIYNGEGVPTVRTFQATSLVTGRPYRFYVLSINHVGKSTASVTVLIYACQSPTGLSAPHKIDVTRSDVTISW